MIQFRFGIQNLFFKPRYNDRFKNICCFTKLIAPNKTFEFEIYRSNLYDLFVLVIDTAWKGEDHAGPKIFVEILGYTVSIVIRDTRHWNDDTNNWVDYSDPHEAAEHG